MTLRHITSAAHRRIAKILVVALSTLQALAPLVAQTVEPMSKNITGGIPPVCAIFPVKITLPPATVTDQVDVFFLFDDTGSFAPFAPSVVGIFSSLVSSLETQLPNVSFGFGVGRFE